MTDAESIRFYFQVIMLTVGGGFVVTFSLLLIIWTSLNKRIDKLRVRQDKLENLVPDLDRRLCRIEGAISNKDCCMIKDERNLKKAE